MKKKFTYLYEALFLILLIGLVFYRQMPQTYDDQEPAPLAEFSTQRALEKVQYLSKRPHYVGSDDHPRIQKYLQQELKALGLEPQLQRGFTLTEKGTLVEATNIMARIKGQKSTKALVLLSHYDSAPHSKSLGASDDASGVATLLESVRALLYNKTPLQNDLILLFTDAEELGLNGAALFVTQHDWAKDVGLVINFEARGTSGPSMMLMETTQGNRAMVEAFAAAQTPYPVSNSLMYSIYKMLPNDTDLTVFREAGKIQGYNFAFIDSHYNYHTAQDHYANLSPLSLAHQGSYVMALLTHFTQRDLRTLEHPEEDVYFSIPFGFVHYPFAWNWPLVLLTAILLFTFTFIGLGKHVLRIDEVVKGFISLVLTLFVAGLVAWGIATLLPWIYPDATTILQGFTYNGHDYIHACIALTLGICFWIYRKETSRFAEMNRLFAGLFLWIILGMGLAWKLPGASFLLLPVLGSTLMLGAFVLTQQSKGLWNLIMALPALFLLVPLIPLFPVGLGLKILPGAAVLTVLTFVLLLPILGAFPYKSRWAFVCLLIGIAFLGKAHWNASFTSAKARPNSLLYVFDASQKKAFWTTYDERPDAWNQAFLSKQPQSAAPLNRNALYSKYGTAFRWMHPAPVYALKGPSIVFDRDTVKGNRRFYQIRITPQRRVNRYDIFLKNQVPLAHVKANGVRPLTYTSKIGGQASHKLLSYYVTRNQPLVFSFDVPVGVEPQLELMESSFDLLEQPRMGVPPRPKNTLPMPFVLNDAVVLIQPVRPTPPEILAQP